MIQVTTISTHASMNPRSLPRVPLAFSALMSLALALAAQSTPVDWPRFRGPGGQGIGPGQDHGKGSLADRRDVRILEHPDSRPRR
jgi:hypothetical protein